MWIITVTENESIRLIETTTEAQAISLTAALNCKGKVFKNASYKRGTHGEAKGQVPS